MCHEAKENELGPRAVDGMARGASRRERVPARNSPKDIFVNSRYQVARWFDTTPMGKCVHLSIKTHDKQAHHDWRDFQRIKNELCGPEFEGVELYPAESRLVDTANQYHLFVFDGLFPFGFGERLVAAPGRSAFAPKSVQRPFENPPADCLRPIDLDRLWADQIGDRKERADG